MRTHTSCIAPRTLFTLVTACVVIEACVFNHGPDLKQIRFEEALGVTVEVRLSKGLTPERLNGELLEVRDSAVMIIVHDESASAVWAVPNNDIESVRPAWSATDSRSFNRSHLGELRLISRFPYGVAPAVLKQILDAYDQAEPRLPTRAQASASAARDPHAHHVAPLDAAADSFMQVARAATERYHDRSMAIADGYRKLGPAFPGMGEHWVHPGLIVSGRLDARQPPVLCYTDIDNVASLVAVAYAVPLMVGETAPTTPMGPSIWHRHGDDLDAETLLLVHGSPNDDPAAPRLAMFHAWTGLDNPDGTFAQNNWQLPFSQLGLDADRPSATAAQTLSLLTVGVDYYMRLFDVIVEHDATDRDAVRAAFATAAQRTRDWRESLNRTTGVGDIELRELEAIWGDLWDSVDARVNAGTRERLRSYPGRAGG